MYVCMYVYMWYACRYVCMYVLASTCPCHGRESLQYTCSAATWQQIGMTSQQGQPSCQHIWAAIRWHISTKSVLLVGDGFENHMFWGSVVFAPEKGKRLAYGAQPQRGLERPAWWRAWPFVLGGMGVCVHACTYGNQFGHNLRYAHALMDMFVGQMQPHMRCANEESACQYG